MAGALDLSGIASPALRQQAQELSKQMVRILGRSRDWDGLPTAEQDRRLDATDGMVERIESRPRRARGAGRGPRRRHHVDADPPEAAPRHRSSRRHDRRTNRIHRHARLDLPGPHRGRAGNVVIGDEMSISIAMSDTAAYRDAAGVMQSSFSQDASVLRAISMHDLIVRRDAAVFVLTGSNITW